MRFIPPITTAEFIHHIQHCMPPVGWPSAISVANSGGPDSTALLFLLSTAVRKQAALISRHSGDTPRDIVGFPQHVLSIHVNHDLQAAASSMQQVASRTALILDVPSLVEKITWGTSPFPAQPGEGDVGERQAREARYYQLFAAMQTVRTDVIALAHHADDQVETTLMRMSQGSSTRGLAGMRPVRRWGMGQKDRELNSFGVEGMHKWIVRPFLNISKDRLLATCEANGLDYVNDPTNFQPAITVRNAIRHVLGPGKPSETQEGRSEGLQFDVAPHVEKLRAMVPHIPPPDQLREAVRLYGIRLEETETQVTNILTQARIPSPPSTLVLNSVVLASVTDQDTRTSLIRRCLRYVSYGPWGSIWAEARGERDVYRRVANELWALHDPTRIRRQFTAAAGVTAIPVAIRFNRMDVRYRPAQTSKNEGEGWILARTAPYQNLGLSLDPLVRDVTDGILDAIRNQKPQYTLLYDNRFVVEFDTRLLPGTVEDEIMLRGARVVIHPDTKWSLPKVVLGLGGNTTPMVIGKFLWYVKGWDQVQKRPVKFQRWIKMDFVRSLDAI